MLWVLTKLFLKGFAALLVFGLIIAAFTFFKAILVPIAVGILFICLCIFLGAFFSDSCYY